MVPRLKIYNELMYLLHFPDYWFPLTIKEKPTTITDW